MYGIDKQQLVFLRKIIILLLLLFVCFSNMIAQSYQSLIIGNVVKSNVNIQILDTKLGTSSDESGAFKIRIPKTPHQIGILFSCVGYQDTLISIVPQQDTIYIRFKMKEISYLLDPAIVTSDKITRFYNKYDFVMFDFEILDDNFFILQKKVGINKDYRVLITDISYKPLDTIFLPQYIEPQYIVLDCFNNCQIVGQDSVYQIIKYNNDYVLAYSSELNHYKTVMGEILFVSDLYLYFKRLSMAGYISEFYRINLKTKQKEPMFFCDNSKTYREIKREVQWYRKNRLIVNNIMHGPSEEDWETFIKNAWYHTKSPYLAKVADTLYYFDHLNGIIQAYDENMDLLQSCNITYPEKEAFWRHTIYQDRVFGKFYTIFGTVLNEINTKTGKTIPRINANSFLSQKMIIYRGNLYSLKKKRDSGNSEISFIEKTKVN